MLQGIYGLFYGLVGSCIGSFLGLCAVRFRTEESVWGPRSHCDSCGHPLGARDLLPLFSYFFNDGKCRFCGAEIPARYFWQELVTACLFLFTGIQTGPCLMLWVRWGILSLLLLLSFLDLEEMQLYEELFYPLGLFFLIYRLLSGASLWQGLAGAIVLGGGMELLRRWKSESLGEGDPKLVGLLGFWLGVLRGGRESAVGCRECLPFCAVPGPTGAAGSLESCLVCADPLRPFSVRRSFFSGLSDLGPSCLAVAGQPPAILPGNAGL